MSTSFEESAKAEFVAEESKLKQRLEKIWNSWATRSLAIGALATVLDLTIGTSLIHFFSASDRVAAMVGTVFGASFTFFVNRRFAFKDKEQKEHDVGGSAVRFLLVTGISSVVHGQLVKMLRLWLPIPFPVAKMLSDLVVFTFLQLLLLRYVVFPKKKVAPPAEASDATKSPVKTS